MDLLKKIKEYFTGAGVRGFYKEYREFYQKYQKNKEKLEKIKRESRIEEMKLLFFNFFIPTVIEVASIAYAFIAKKPEIGVTGVAGGEVVRYLSIMKSQEIKSKRAIEMDQDLLSDLKQGLDYLRQELKSAEDQTKDIENEIDKLKESIDTVINSLETDLNKESWKQGLYDFSGDWWKEGKKPKGMEED